MKILSPNQSRLTAVIAIPVLAAFILSTVGLAGIQIRPMDDDAKQEETTTSSTTIWTTVDDEVGRVSMSIDQKGDAAIDWKEGKIQNISEDGHIDVKASLDDSECQVVVTNDGEGLSFEWTIRGKKKDWNDEGQSWLKQVLLVMGCHQEIGELHGKCGELHGKIGSLHGEEGALQGKIGSIHGRIGSLQGKIGAIQGRVGGLHGQIGGVKSQLNAIRNRPGKGDDRSKRREQELTSRLSALEDELATFDADAKIRSIEGEIAKVQTSEIANIEAEIKALDVAKRVSVIEQRISDLKIDEKVNAIQERLKPLNRELEKKTRKVLNIKNRIII